MMKSAVGLVNVAALSVAVLACGGASPLLDAPGTGGASMSGGSGGSAAGAALGAGGKPEGAAGELVMLSCPPAPDVLVTCPEAFDGTIAGPPEVGPLGLVPVPMMTQLGRGSIVLSSESRIVAPPSATAVAELLAEPLRASSGLPLPVSTSCGGGTDVVLALDPSQTIPDEGYRLKVECSRATITARTLAGLFYGTQTLRELLPAATLEPTQQSIPAVTIPRVRIEDAPRFAWRGFMLDVARHFSSVDEVKRLIALAAFHKLNRFHLHLSDDQGWRIQIDSWPKLTTTGSHSEVGGGDGGYYTKAQFAELVEYAAARSMIIVPEIDMPGHTNAALASYPSELTASGAPPEPWPYTGVEVGFSSLWIGGPHTEDFVSDVIGELAEMTGGPYLHIGGDEAQRTSLSGYKTFLSLAKTIVESKGKQLVGWAEIGRASLGSKPLAQHWNDDAPDGALAAQAQGMKLIMSPAQRGTYLDMKYSDQTKIGQDWAGFISLEQAYNFEPTSPQIPESSVIGIEAALWTEFVTSRSDIDYLTFPRLAGHAEIGWSKKNGRSYDEYKPRLAIHGARLRALGVGYFASPDIAW